MTEISPQSQSISPSSCFYNLTTQDWKNVILQLVTNVENSAPADAGTWWGGIMLNEEDGFWTSTPSAAAYQDLNSSVRTLMATTPGISWFYTETFSGASVWSQNDFGLVTGTSHAAPDIATDYMVLLTNVWHASSQAAVLVTWSLNSDYHLDPHGLYGSEFRIDGAPLNQWGLNLTNCFTTMATACNDWDADGIPNSSDPDNDNDGCGNTHEPQLGLNPYNPWDFYSVPVPALIAAPNPVGLHADNVVAGEDAQAVFAYALSGAKIGTLEYDGDLNQNGLPDGWEYDRTQLGPAQSGPPDGVITGADAQLAWAQARLAYRC